jgi:hypothetical protein
MSQANIRSIEALRAFKHALITFSEDARNALTSVEMEVRRTRNWLERDQIAFWKGQIKKSQELLQQAKADLYRRQLSQQNSESVSDAEQKEAVRKAKRRLEEAEAKFEKCRKWAPVLEHAIAEYHSQSQPLGDRLAGGLVQSIALLDRMINAIDEYLAMSPPPTAAVHTGSGGSSTASPGGKTSAASTAAGGEVAAATAEPAAAAGADGASAPAAATEESNGDGQATKPEGVTAGHA